MAEITETTLLVDLQAVDHNSHYIRSLLDPSTKLLAVVKASGYGSSMVDVAKELAAIGVDYFAVAYTSEGVMLRDAGIRTPVLVLHPLPANFRTLIDRCLEPSMYSLKVLDQFIAQAEEAGQTNYPVHLKLNTGLNRLGLGKREDDLALSKIRQHNAIKVRSIFSHLAASEDIRERSFSEGQIRAFEQRSDYLIPGLGHDVMRHMLNSSGIFNYPSAQFDMVRSGIGLYGFGNDSRFTAQLRPVAQLKTVISQIHQLKAGDSLGYNRAFVAEKPTRTATLPLGHADGISRAYGQGKGWVSVLGEKAPIIGNVCMDMMMVDVTGIPCEEGEVVTVFGTSPAAEELAGSAGTIPYELLTAISSRVKRKVIGKEIG